MVRMKNPLLLWRGFNKNKEYGLVQGQHENPLAIVKGLPLYCREVSIRVNKSAWIGTRSGLKILAMVRRDWEMAISGGSTVIMVSPWTEYLKTSVIISVILWSFCLCYQTLNRNKTFSILFSFWNCFNLITKQASSMQTWYRVNNKLFRWSLLL